MGVQAYLQFALALVFVLGLIGLLAWLVRRFNLLGPMAVKRGPERRLGVIEMQMLGAKHRLVLVRRDQVEHLVLIGPAGDLLVEGNIAAPATGVRISSIVNPGGAP